jgi:hypothetical protein
MPVPRWTWGQSLDSASHYYDEETDNLYRFHRYIHHWDTEEIYADPIYDLLTGRVKGYHYYRKSDIIPVSKVLEIKYARTSIGIPRWVLEIAQPVDPMDWDQKRQGPLPQGSVDYFCWKVIGQHSNHLIGDDPECCVVKRWRGKRCFGEYRSPNMQDILLTRAQWVKYHRNRPNN